VVSVRRSQLFAFSSLALMSAAVLVPASMTFAAETPAAYAAPAELPLLTPAAPTIGQLNLLRFRRIAAETFARRETQPAADTDDQDDAHASLDAETLCMAKVVHHEAGNQSREGQLAVAQTIVNRVESGRFAGSVCGVVHQRNQYFDTTRYHPDRDSSQWQSAVNVAYEVLSGKAQPVVPGALFFRAAYAAPTGFFKGRTRIAALGDHVFYR
jgi:spore germination cell wall hydrolase CwlJ-like protein